MNLSGLRQVPGGAIKQAAEHKSVMERNRTIFPSPAQSPKFRCVFTTQLLRVFLVPGPVLGTKVPLRTKAAVLDMGVAEG